MKKIKVFSIVFSCALLVACSTQTATSNSNSTFSVASNSTVSQLPVQSELLKEYSQYDVIGENGLLIFQGENTEYSKNGEKIAIEGLTPVIEDGMLYFPLEFIFDLFKMDNYEEFKENWGVRTEFGGVEIYSSDGQKKEFSITDETNTIVSMGIALGKINKSYVNEETLERLEENTIIRNGNIYIPASLLELFPASMAQNMMEKQHARYFPNNQMLVIYNDITPPASFYPNLQEEPERNEWQQVYTNIANGTDPLGFSYMPVPNWEQYWNLNNTAIVGYYVYDFDNNGTPEVLFYVERHALHYMEAFTVEDGLAKYLGRFYVGGYDYPTVIEKETGYLVPYDHRVPYTYAFENGEFLLVDDKDYVQFEEGKDERGIFTIEQKTFKEDEVIELERYDTIEEAIAGYEASQK